MAAPARACTDVEEFLRTKTFHCKYLDADLTPANCVERQKTKVEQVKSWGIRFNRSNDLQSTHCRSGKCEQGRLVRLGVGASRNDTPTHRARALDGSEGNGQ